MADKYYITKNGSPVNYQVGKTRLVRSNTEPSSCDFELVQSYETALPIIGQEIHLYLQDESLYFHGSIDEVNWAQIEETSNYLHIPVKCTGMDLRLFRRITWDRTKDPDQPSQYRSYTGWCDVSGTAITRINGTFFGRDTEGDHFSKEFLTLSGKIFIDGVEKTVSSVSSPDELVLSSSATTATNVPYEVKVFSRDVIIDLLDKCCEDEDFVYDTSTIDLGVQIGELVYDPPVSVYDAITEVVKLNTDMHFWLNSNTMTCYFKPLVYVAAPSDFDDTPDNYKRNINVQSSRSDVRNVEVSAFDQIGAIVNTFTTNGDGVTRAWFLEQKILKLIQVILNGVDSTERAREWNGESPIEADYFFKARDWGFWQSDVAVPLEAADELVVKFYSVGGNLGEYSDFDSIEYRKTVEVTGSGKYETYIDRQKFAQWPDAQTDSANSVTAHKDDVHEVSLVTKDLGYDVGQLVNLDLTKNKLSDDFYIERVEATDSGLEGGNSFGDFWYTLSLVSNSRRIAENSVLRDLFNPGGAPEHLLTGGSLGEGGSGSGSGAGGVHVRTFDIADAAVVARASNSVPAVGVRINASSVLRRITCVVDKTLTADLVVTFHLVYPDLTTHDIGTFTAPVGTTLQQTLSFTTFDWSTLPDKCVIYPEIVSSGNEADEHGVATWTLEYIGRGSGAMEVTGYTWKGEWDEGTDYDFQDLVKHNGSVYVGTIEGLATNTGNEPGVDAGWDLFVEKGDPGADGADGTNGTDGADGPGYYATSTSSVAIGTGSKTFTTQAALAYSANARVRVAYDASNYMEGVVTSYSGTSLAVNVDRVVGSGTYASWTINLAGDVGASGASSGVVGTAIFSASGGTIGNTYYSGCISSVTRSSTGVFVVHLSPSQQNFTVSITPSDDVTVPMFAFFNGTPNLNTSLSSFTIITYAFTNTVRDPGICCVTITKL